MNENLKFLLQICGFTSILLVVAIISVNLFGRSYLVGAVFYGYLVSLVNILFSFYSIKWAFNKPNSTFFAVVLGGMGVRFLILIAALFFVWKFTQIPLTAFIVFLVAFYLTLQFFEIKYIQKQLKIRKAVS
ncbi:hypothetical protein IH785_09450 [candidate division KSB1 bacterium]|nr:hypothetical protein [candidate division KSB1 bacterium]